MSFRMLSDDMQVDHTATISLATYNRGVCVGSNRISQQLAGVNTAICHRTLGQSRQITVICRVSSDRSRTYTTAPESRHHKDLVSDRYYSHFLLSRIPLVAWLYVLRNQARETLPQ